MFKKFKKISVLLLLALILAMPSKVMADTETIRITGNNRMETSIEAAKASPSDKLVITDAYSYPDAISSANISNKLGANIVLVDKDTKLENYFEEDSFKEVFVVGGLVTDEVIESAKKVGEEVTLFVGKDRYETNQKILDFLGYEKVILVKGDTFADAVSASPLAKHEDLGIELVDKVEDAKKEVVYVVGGRLEDKGIGTYISGKDRLETNKMVNNQIGAKKTVLVNSVDFADALSAMNLIKDGDTDLSLANSSREYEITYILGDPEKKEEVSLTGQEAVVEEVKEEEKEEFKWDGPKLTKRKGVNYGPTGKETYYNLPMGGVIRIMRGIGNNDKYWVRDDGVKMLGDYVMVAANLSKFPRGSHVPTSLGMGVVCDTGGFAKRNPTQLDIAVSW